VVQDKLFLPGLVKLKNLIDCGFFGELLSVRGEFGYWVFTGHDAIAPQRPSWNYRKEDGGGIIVDMLYHWRYVLDNLFGEVQAVSCLGATHIKERIDESGNPYVCTADDAAYATFQLKNGVVAQFNSSWTVRVRRDDLLTLQVDGTKGSAVAGLRDCVIQPYGATPRPVWNPDIPSPIDFSENWMTVPTNQILETGRGWPEKLGRETLDRAYGATRMRMLKLTDTEIAESLNALSGWTIDGAGMLRKTFVFAGFPEAIAFTMKVAFAAEKADHHPDIDIRWSRVTLALTTHDSGGLTQSDFDLATQADSLSS
jgi:pterin-4a-carbinolamine dehydratase